MPSNAPIVIDDGKSTPESHTFDPSDMTGSQAAYTNYAGTYPPGRDTIRMSKSLKASGKVREVTVTLVVPNTVTIDGISSVADFRTYVVRCLVPVSTLETDLDSDTGMLANLLGNTLVKKAIERGEWIW